MDLHGDHVCKHYEIDRVSTKVELRTKAKGDSARVAFHIIEADARHHVRRVVRTRRTT